MDLFMGCISEIEQEQINLQSKVTQLLFEALLEAIKVLLNPAYKIEDPEKILNELANISSFQKKDSAFIQIFRLAYANCDQCQAFFDEAKDKSNSDVDKVLSQLAAIVNEIKLERKEITRSVLDLVFKYLTNLLSELSTKIRNNQDGDWAEKTSMMTRSNRILKIP